MSSAGFDGLLPEKQSEKKVDWREISVIREPGPGQKGYIKGTYWEYPLHNKSQRTWVL